MTIATGIVAHTFREQTARCLRRATGAIVMNIDDGQLGCENNHIVVLDALMRHHVDWCVVLEDDAKPVDDFRFHVKQALAHAPAPIVGLYLGYGNPSGETQRQTGQAARTAEAEDKAWIIGDCLIGSVGYAIRIRLIEPMLVFANTQGYEWPLRISRWAQTNNVAVCYTAPSLVDHDSLPSTDCTLMRQDMPVSERKAWIWGTRDNWDTGAVPLGYCPGWSARRD